MAETSWDPESLLSTPVDLGVTETVAAAAAVAAGIGAAHGSKNMDHPLAQTIASSSKTSHPECLGKTLRI